MEGKIIGRSRQRDALMFRNWKGVFLCAGYSFVPSFQVIVQRYWFEIDDLARELIATLDDPELRELLSLAESVGPATLPENGGRALRKRVKNALLNDRIRVYRFTELHYAALNHAHQTLLADMRTVRGLDIGNQAQASPQELREAITYELSRSLIERGLTKEAWDRTLRDEGVFWGGVIRAGAAMQGAVDYAKGLADTASLVVDVGKDIGAGLYAVARFHFEINQAVLTGHFDKANQMVRELGGQIAQKVDDLKRYYDAGKRVFEVLFAEPVVGVMLTQYGLAYASATPKTEQIRGMITLGGDVLLSVGIAVLTGGAGLGAAAANLARSVGMFSGRLIQLLVRLYQAMSKAAEAAARAAEEARLLKRVLPTQRSAPNGASLRTENLGRGIGTSDGGDAPLPTKKTVYSGHGGYDPADGEFVVPARSSVTVYAEHGASITDELGQAVETNQDVSKVFRQTYDSGQVMPNYTLYPPDEKIVIKGDPVTVQRPTKISDLIKEGQGECHWAACLASDNTPASHKAFDICGVIDCKKESWINIYD